MLMHLKRFQPFVIVAIVLNLVVPAGVAQDLRPCKNGSCGSPLAGPCVPARHLRPRAD